MLGVMLAKDLRRVWRNPLPWLIFLAVPLLIVTLIGSAFGPRAAGEGELGRIRFALVDEDESPMTGFLRGAMNQAEGAKYLDPVRLERDEAERQLRENQLSAMLVIPRGFTRDYLTTTNVVALELLKNPAQSIHPAVLEELLGVVVTGLDAVKRHLAAELPEWQAVFEGDGDYRRVAELIVRAGERLEAAREFLNPLRVSYVKEEPGAAGNASATDDSKNDEATTRKAGRPAFNLFGYLLPGLAAMFLLFLGNNATTDLKREFRGGTLARTRTLHHRLFAFVGSKLAFAVVMLWICGAILLGGGGFVFGIVWRDPLAMTALTACYGVFAAGLMCLLGSLFVGEERADAFSNLVAMGVGLAGGGAFPAHQLPSLLRDHVTPWLPNHWYTEAVRELAFGNADVTWRVTALLSLGMGLAGAGVAAWLLQRRIERGKGA